jgi:hypothetical protein
VSFLTLILVSAPGDERAKADARREKKRLQEQQRRKRKKLVKQGLASGSSMFLDEDEHGGSGSSRPRERAGSIKITKEAMQNYKSQKKRSARELPEHLQVSRVDPALTDFLHSALLYPSNPTVKLRGCASMPLCLALPDLTLTRSNSPTPMLSTPIPPHPT